MQARRLVANKRVLDVGCNTGYGTNILCKSAGKVIGVDVSESAIELANDQYGHRGIEFLNIDGQDLPFEDQSFDFVVSFQVIEHIVDYSKFINEMKRVLTLDGVIIFTTPNALLRLYPGMKPWNKFHVREFNHHEFKDMLEGFFENVAIFGLYAGDKLYSIEVNRLTKERNNAMSRSEQSAFRAYINKMVPQKVVEFLKKNRRSSTRDSAAEVATLMNNHSVEEFFYQQNDLEAALDLLAACANDDKVFDDVKSKIGRS